MPPSALDVYFANLNLPAEVTLIADQALSSGSGWTALQRKLFSVESSESAANDRWKTSAASETPVPSCYHPRSNSLSQLDTKRMQQLEEDTGRMDRRITSNKNYSTTCAAFASLPQRRSHLSSHLMPRSAWDCRLQPQRPNQAVRYGNSVYKHDMAPVVPRRWCSSSTKISPPHLRSVQDDKLSVDNHFLLNGSQRHRATSPKTPSNVSNHSNEDQDQHLYRLVQLDGHSQEDEGRDTRVLLPKIDPPKPQTKVAKTA